MGEKILVGMYLTRKEAAEIIKSSVKTVDRLLKESRIDGFKIGRKVLIYSSSLTKENINAIKPKFLN